MHRFSLLAALLVILASTHVHSAGHGHEHEHEPEHESHRQSGAHVHGLAELTLAQEGGEIELSLSSPSANIVGFEHKASSSEQIHKVEDAEQTLRSGNRLFTFSGTTCQLEYATVDVSALLDHHTEHENEHHDHKDGHHDDDPHHDEHAHKQQRHEDHGEHAEETHSEITALYHFECSNVAQLSAVEVNLFNHFPGIEELHTMWVTDNHQGSAELSKSSKTFRLR